MFSEKSYFIELYSREQKKIFLYILSLVHRRSDAEDLLQQTASEMWHMFDRFEKGSNFASWGIAIAKYKILNYRKDQKKDRLFLSQEVYEKVIEELQNAKKDSDKRKDALQGCLRKLKELDRKMLSMHYEDSLSYQEIAKQLNHSRSVIYKVMARIHFNLEKCINKTLLVWDTNG